MFVLIFVELVIGTSSLSVWSSSTSSLSRGWSLSTSSFVGLLGPDTLGAGKRSLLISGDGSAQGLPIREQGVHLST